jgi:glycosyltransferase involved in cell wall biosynthesis
MTGKPAIALVVPGGIGVDDNIPALLDLIRRLAVTFEITLYSFSPQDVHPSLMRSSCTVVFVPSGIKFNLFRAVFLFHRIRNEHAAKHFIAVHGFWILWQGLVAVCAGKRLNIPSIITVPGGDITYIPAIKYGGLSNPIKKFVVRWCMAHAGRIVLLTQFQKFEMERHGISREHAATIPFGVDTARIPFHPHPLSSPVQLLFIGNLSPVKDPFTLIDTFQMLRKNFDCVLTIIGSDILQGAVHAYARTRKVNDHIRWMGKLPFEDIPAHLSRADILLVTSRFEGQSVVVLEAFAAGVLVVGTRVGLLADVKDNALTAKPGDAPGLSDLVTTVVRHPETVEARQRANRIYAEQFSAEWTYTRYLELFNELGAWNRR